MLYRSVKTESKMRKKRHCKSQQISLSYFPAKIFLEKFETFSNIPGHRTMTQKPHNIWQYPKVETFSWESNY